MTEREYWDNAAQSENVRDEWICDKNVTDIECLLAIIPHLNGPIGEYRTLDLGCGIGRLTLGYGVDISPEMIERAKPGSEYKVCDGRSIPYPDEFFDNVFSVFMFQHIPDEAKLQYITEVRRVLRPGGRFRLQYVQGGEPGPFNYPTEKIDLFGFEVTDETRGLIYPQWIWITGKKL